MVTCGVASSSYLDCIDGEVEETVATEMEFEVGAEVEVKEEISLEEHSLVLEAFPAEMNFEVGAELELKEEEDVAQELELVLENNPKYFSWDSVVSDESTYEDETPYEYFCSDSSDIQNFVGPVYLRQNSACKNKKRYTYKKKKKYGFESEYKTRHKQKQEAKYSQCHFCGKNCVCIEYLNLHLEGYHAVVRVPVKCPCGIQLDTLNTFNSHFASCRMMSFGCAWCEQSFHSLSELNVHWSSHNQPEPYSECCDFDLKNVQPPGSMLNHYSQRCTSPQNDNQASQLQNSLVHYKECSVPAVRPKLFVSWDNEKTNTVHENLRHLLVDQNKVDQKAGTFMPVVTGIQKSCGSQVNGQGELNRNFLITRLTSLKISRFSLEGELLNQNELSINDENEVLRYCPVCQINFLTGKDETECLCIACCEPLVEGFCLSGNEGSPPQCDQCSKCPRESQENQRCFHLPLEKSYLSSACSESSSVQVDTKMNFKFHSLRKQSDFAENTCSLVKQAESHFISVGLSEAESSCCKKVHNQGQDSTDENSVWTSGADSWHMLASDIVCKNEPEDDEAFSTSINTTSVSGCSCRPERDEHMFCKKCKASLSKGTYRLSTWLITVHFCQNCKSTGNNKDLELFTSQRSPWKPFVCGICEKEFSERVNCIRHLASHLKGKNPSSYVSLHIVDDEAEEKISPFLSTSDCSPSIKDELQTSEGTFSIVFQKELLQGITGQQLIKHETDILAGSKEMCDPSACISKKHFRVLKNNEEEVKVQASYIIQTCDLSNININNMEEVKKVPTLPFKKEFWIGAPDKEEQYTNKAHRQNKDKHKQTNKKSMVELPSLMKRKGTVTRWLKYKKHWKNSTGRLTSVKLKTTATQQLKYKTKSKCRLCQVAHNQLKSDRGPKLHKCDCGRAFRSKLHLLRHHLFHLQSTVFICTVCGQCLKGIRSLERHSEEHQNIMYFCCPCGEEFRRFAGYLWHKLKNNSSLLLSY